jgi:hypothetical protein
MCFIKAFSKQAPSSADLRLNASRPIIPSHFPRRPGKDRRITGGACIGACLSAASTYQGIRGDQSPTNLLLGKARSLLPSPPNSSSSFHTIQTPTCTISDRLFWRIRQSLGLLLVCCILCLATSCPLSNLFLPHLPKTGPR